MAISRVPSLPLTKGRRTVFATAVVASRTRLVALPGSNTTSSGRRTYWSWRRGNGRYIDRPFYQYWATYPSLLRSKYRQFKKDSGRCSSSSHDSTRDSTTYTTEQKGGQKQPSARKQDPTQAGVQAEEQRFYEEWQRMTKEHWKSHMQFLKQAVERDPYVALFGMRQKRGVWNPFDLKWPGSRAEEGETDADHAKDQKPRRTQYAQETPTAPETATTSREPSVKADTEPPTAKRVESAQQNTTASVSGVEETYIDPVTLRRVTRIKFSPEVVEAMNEQRPTEGREAEDKVVDIPVKVFQPKNHDTKSQEPKDNISRPLAGFAAQPWLQQEGFSEQLPTPPKKYFPGPPSKDPSPAPKAFHISAAPGSSSVGEVLANAKIESSLNRRESKETHTSVSNEGSPSDMNTSITAETKQSQQYPDSKVSPKSRPIYGVEDSKTEDIDLLRASDVRAAAGHLRARPTISPEELVKRRMELYSTFIESQRKFENQLKEEIVSALKHQETPTKSPLWALWMLYDHAARKDWAKWSKEKHFRLRGHEEFEEMQALSKAFRDQMPTPPEIFKSGGSSLGRYLDANRVSLVLRDLKTFLNSWHMEMQTILTKRGARPFSESILEDFRKALHRYHNELRQQILSGYTQPNGVPKTTNSKEYQKLFDNNPTAEMKNYRDAMRRFEEQAKTKGKESLTDTKNWTLWSPSATKNSVDSAAKKDESLVAAIKDFYEENKAAFHPGPSETQGSSAIPATVLNEKHVASMPVSSQWVPTATDLPAETLDKPSRSSITPSVTRQSAKETEAKEQSTTTSASSQLQSVLDTVVLQINQEDADVMVHKLKAPAVKDITSLDTASGEGFNRFIDFMDRADRKRMVPVMRLDVDLSSKGYRLVDHSPQQLIYQNLASEAIPDADVKPQDRLVELITQEYPSFTKPDASIAEQLAGATGTRIYAFKLEEPSPSSTAQEATSIRQSQDPVSNVSTKSTEPTTQQTTTPFTEAGAEQSHPVNSSYLPAQHLSSTSSHPSPPPQSTPSQSSDPHQTPLESQWADEPISKSTPPSPTNQSTQPISRTEPVFSGRPLHRSKYAHQSQHQYQHHSHRHHPHRKRGKHSPHRRLRRFARAVGRMFSTLFFVLIGAYTAGLFMEWKINRDLQRSREQRDASGFESVGAAGSARDQHTRDAGPPPLRRI